MNVINIHERRLQAPSNEVGKLLDSLSSKNDILWPRRTWPPMKLDRLIETGAIGGHGPIRYTIVEYKPGKSVQFCFTSPKGFKGFHKFEVIANFEDDKTLLRHTLKMNTHGMARISWLLVIRPLHDACIENALAKAQLSLGLKPDTVKWSLWVRFLRWLFSGGKAAKQQIAI